MSIQSFFDPKKPAHAIEFLLKNANAIHMHSYALEIYKHAPSQGSTIPDLVKCIRQKNKYLRINFNTLLHISSFEKRKGVLDWVLTEFR
jgi:hypothetical protein